MTNAARALCASISALALCAALPAFARAAADDKADAVISASRTALGGAALDGARVLALQAQINQAGLSGTGESWSEVGGVRFAEKFSTPPISGGDGYDGTNVWNSDGSGLVWTDGGTAGRSLEIAQAFINDYALYRPDRGGATVEWNGSKTDAGHTYDVLSISVPHSAVPIDLWIDSATHLPGRSVQTIGAVTTTTTMSDYRRVGGIMTPYAIHQETSDGNASDTKIVAATVDAPGESAHLARPLSNVSDFSIEGGAAQTVIPIDLIENHVYLSVMLNGKGPYRFIYDTGGLNLVDPAVAKEIGTAGSGSMQGTGVGSTTEAINFATVDSLRVGDAVVKNQLFFVAPTRAGFGVSGGRSVDGLIGFEVLSRFVTTFDYANNRVILTMPDKAQNDPGAQTIPFVLDGRQPQFGCAIDGIATQCTLDTGARDSITLMAPFMAAHPQIVPQMLTAIGVNGFGLGGPSLGRLGRLASVGIGTFDIPNVVADFTTQDKGAFAAPFLAANVGGNLLRRFTMTLDYGKLTMALTPNSSFAKRDEYERAGLFLLNMGGKKVVADSRPGTPAAAAGIAKGDVIETIAGKDASTMTLQEVRNMFVQAPGTTIHMTVLSKTGVKKSVTLVLKDFI